ncbi:MAG: hypothetical protein Q9195_002837 [Heterodermia aff. obscurata]
MAVMTPLEERLLQIPSEHVEQFHVILQWLAVGDEPLLGVDEWSLHLLTLTELAETTIVVPQTFSVTDSRRLTSDFIVERLNGIVEVYEVRRNHHISDDETLTGLRFVEGAREELLSEDFRRGSASMYAIEEAQAKKVVADTCLAFLIRPDAPEPAQSWYEAEEKYPLVLFSALFWPYFLDNQNMSQNTTDAIRKLFTKGSHTFNMWIAMLYQATNKHMNNRRGDVIRATGTYDFLGGHDIPPIVWAAAFNIKFVVEELLAQGNSVNEAGKKSVSALYIAVHEQHYEMTDLLLRNGGDVGDNYEEPFGKYEYPSAVAPLYHASHRGYSREWMDLLLRDKGKFTRPGWRLEVAMETAARFGYIDCLQALVDAGADINKASGNEESYGSPLQAACDWAEGATVRWLLESGADPNKTGDNLWLGPVHTSLHMASWRGDVDKVRTLLEFRADTNIEGGLFGTALIAAVWNPHRAPTDGSLEVVELLLQHSARSDIEWDMTSLLYELNFTYYEEPKLPSSTTFGDSLAVWIKSKEFDENDKSEGSESVLRERIDAKWEGIHEGQRQKKFGYACGCMNHKAFEARYKVCRKIRRSAALISKRLREAGVIKDSEGRYMMNAIQAAVAMERPTMIESLIRYGAEMPTVALGGPRDDIEDAEAIARMLRTMDSFHHQERSKNGGSGSGGSQGLP